MFLLCSLPFLPECGLWRDIAPGPTDPRRTPSSCRPGSKAFALRIRRQSPDATADARRIMGPEPQARAPGAVGWSARLPRFRISIQSMETLPARLINFYRSSTGTGRGRSGKRFTLHLYGNVRSSGPKTTTHPRLYSSIFHFSAVTELTLLLYRGWRGWRPITTTSAPARLAILLHSQHASASCPFIADTGAQLTWRQRQGNRQRPHLPTRMYWRRWDQRPV